MLLTQSWPATGEHIHISGKVVPPLCCSVNNRLLLDILLALLGSFLTTYR